MKTARLLAKAPHGEQTRYVLFAFIYAKRLSLSLF